MDFHLLGWVILIFHLFFLYGLFHCGLLNLFFQNVFVLDFRACQYFGFVRLGCSSAVLIISSLLLTVLTPDFGLYLKDVKCLNFCYCRSFFGCTFIECYNVHYFSVIFFFQLLLWDCFGFISVCFSFFHSVLPQYATLYFMNTIDLLCCFRFIYQSSTKSWSKLYMVGSCVVSSPFASSFSCIHFDKKSLCELNLTFLKRLSFIVSLSVLWF